MSFRRCRAGLVLGLALALVRIDPAGAARPPAPTRADGSPEPVVSVLDLVDEAPFRSQVEAAWFAGGDLGSRVADTRTTALELGMTNVEAAARALLADSGDGEALGRALLAVRLAPDLPLARMALARAHWREGERRAAIEEAVQGLLAIPRHLEATVWIAASFLAMFVAVLVGGSFYFILSVGASVFSHAAHDLGDLFSREMPAFARAALLGTFVLVPLLLGEGWMGLAVVLFALGFAYGGSRHRMVLALAAVLVVLGMHPVTRFAGTALSALDADPVAKAVLDVVRGSDSREDIELLSAAAEEDPLAEHALALKVRQLGDLEQARSRYLALQEQQPRDPVVLANLGNLLFQRGETAAATDLYQRAAGLLASPTLMFDLSQSYARSFRMEEFENAMQKAQRLGSDAVAELSRNGDPDFVADLPFPMEEVRQRILASARGDGFAQALARRVAPGHLGGSWWATALGFAGAGLAGLVLGGRYQHSSRCTRCGRRICGRCDGNVWNSEICDPCHRLFHRTEGTDSSLRMARLSRLRRREKRLERLGLLAAFAVPGSSGLRARRPDLAFVGILCFAWALVSTLWRGGVVPDPLAVGAAGPLAFLLLGAMALAAYLVVVAACLLIRRSL